MSQSRPSHLRVVTNPEVRVVAPIVIPPLLQARLDAIGVAFAREVGETPERVRRAVEMTVLQRGIESLEKEFENK